MVSQSTLQPSAFIETDPGSPKEDIEYSVKNTHTEDCCEQLTEILKLVLTSLVLYIFPFFTFSLILADELFIPTPFSQSPVSCQCICIFFFFFVCFIFTLFTGEASSTSDIKWPLIRGQFH